MRVAILGLGAAGRGFSFALARPGVECVLAARDFERARSLARMTGALAASSDAEAADGADVVLLAVHEATLVARAEALAESASKPGVALHLAGSLSPDVLEPLRRAGWSVGRMHPLVALCPGSDGRHLRGATFAVAGDKPSERAAQQVVAHLDGITLPVAAGQEAAYHAAAALVAGGAVALLASAAEAVAPTLKASPDAPRAARRALATLLSSVAANLEVADAADALTGPVARGSIDTVQAHLSALNGDAEAYYRGVLPRLIELSSERLTPTEMRRLKSLVENDTTDGA